MFLSMLCLTLAAGPQNPPATRTTDRPATADSAASFKLDGNWTVVCFEKNGQPVADAKGKTVIAKDNTFTCTSKEGKAGGIWKIDFSNRGQLTCTEIQSESGSKATGADAMSKSGVYVLTHDMLAICVHDTDSGTVTAGSPPKDHCAIILKREGTGRSEK